MLESYPSCASAEEGHPRTFPEQTLLCAPGGGGNCRLKAVTDTFDLDFGDFRVSGVFDGLESGEEGLVAEVVGEGAEISLVGSGGDGHGNLEGATGFESEGNVLFGQAEGEAGIFEAPREQVGHQSDEGAGSADFEHAIELFNIEASFGTEDEALLCDLAAAEDDGVVDQFDEAASTCLTEEEDVLTDNFEQRINAVEGVSVAAGEQGEGAAFGASDAAGDGAIDVEDTALSLAGCHSLDSSNGVRGEVDVDVTVPGAAEKAVACVDDVFDLERAGQGGKDDAGGSGNFGGGASPNSSEFEQILGYLLSGVVDDEVVASLDQVLGHGVADITGANEANRS